MSEEKNTRPDARCGVEFLAGVVCWAVSIYVMAKSITFWKEDYVDEFYYSSGLMPMIIGIALFAISLIYIIRTVRTYKFRNCIADIRDFAVDFVKSKYVHKALVGLVIMWVYIYLFLGKIPFWLGTVVALSALLIFMNWKKPMDVKKIVKLVVIAVGATAAIILVFQVLFKVPLP